MSVQAIGQPVRREEDLRLLKGRGRYVDDVQEPNEARGYVLRSPHAHARIVAIDARRRDAAPGVLAVLTGEDLRRRGLGTLMPGVPPQAAQWRAGLCLPAAAAGARPRPLCRGPGRVRRGRDAEPGQGCRRADRDRVRAAAGGDRRRGGTCARTPLRYGTKTRGTRRSFTRSATELRSRPPLPEPPISSATRWSSTGSPPTAWSRGAVSRSTTADRGPLYDPLHDPVGACHQAPHSPTASSSCRSTSSGWSATIWVAASG